MTNDHVQLDTRNPFTRKAALAADLPLSELLSSRFRRIFHGIYLAADIEVTTAVRARAALLVAPDGSYASHHTAIVLWGGWAPDTNETHISSPITRTRSERRGIVAHAANEEITPSVRLGIQVSPATQAFLELAATRVDLVDLVVCGDSLVRAGAVEPEDLVRAADRAKGQRWCRLARRAARLVREGVDSVMESRVRMLIVLAGLPEPTVNYVLRTAEGDWVRRLDLCYRNGKIAVEYDGRHHLETKKRREDLIRREELERQGWLFVVLVSDDIYVDPCATVERVRLALIQRDQHERRRRLSPEWMRCFPGRSAAA